jgi:uncharacterized protein YkwD
MDWGWISLAVGTIVLAFVVFRYRPKNYIYNFEEAILKTDEKKFKNLLNHYRISVGLGTVKTDKVAGLIAYKHCIKMVTRQSVFHNKEDFRYDGLKGASNFSEIVNGEFYNVDTCFEGFMDSERHFRIINGNFNTIGLSIERDDDNKVYCTVIFFNI